jgi:hypothetical protein
MGNDSLAGEPQSATAATEWDRGGRHAARAQEKGRSHL